MSASASGKGSGGDGVRGRPIRPGQTLNPAGNNQYTYKRDYERTIDRILAGKYDQDVTAELLKVIPEVARTAVEQLGADVTPGEVLAVVVTAKALAADEKPLTELLKRVWPVTSKHEVSGLEGASLVKSELPDGLECLSDEEQAELRKLGRKMLMGSPPTAEA